MALIIKGDMPTFCERLNKNGDMEYCRFACVCESHNISTMAIPSDCPILGEIPDKHGDLIDVDELLASDAINWGEEAWNGINHAPVILEENYE